MPATLSAVVLLTNSERVRPLERLSDALVSAVMTPPDIPQVRGPLAVDVARNMFHRLQAGSVNRTELAEEFSAFLTDERLRGAAERLAPYGEPSDVDLLSMHERAGLEVSTAQFRIKKGTLEASMIRRPDGKVEEFLVDKP
jgi:hypothetical protein